MLMFINLIKLLLAIKIKEGGVGGLHEIFVEIDFLVVFYKGDKYLSDDFGPISWKNIDRSRSYRQSKVNAIFNHLP